MEVLKQYKALDGRIFTDRFECARWELSINPEVIGLLEDAMHNIGNEAQLRWCGGDPEVSSGAYACGCMGCANRYFYKLDLQYEHWKIWSEEFRDPLKVVPEEGDDVVLSVTSYNKETRIQTIQAVKDHTGLGMVDAWNIIKDQSQILFIYQNACALKNELDTLGATCKIQLSQ